MIKYYQPLKKAKEIYERTKSSINSVQFTKNSCPRTLF